MIITEYLRRGMLCLAPFRRSIPAITLAFLGFIAGAIASPVWIEGQVLVRYREESLSNRTVAHRLPLPPGGRQRSLAALSRVKRKPVVLVSVPGRATEDLLAEYAGRPEVESVTPNYRRHIHRSLIPNDPHFHYQWGLLNTGQTVNWYTGLAGADIGATRAWPMSRTVTGEGVIAIIDTGVDYRHPDLAASMWINPGEQPDTGRDDDGNGYRDDVFGYDFSGADLPASGYFQAPGPDPMDIDGHGTHVAGIAAATVNNAIGMAGVAPARIMALKASPDGLSIPLSDSLEAMAYAVMMKRDYGVPVTVINASYGGVGGSNSLERDMIIEAGAAGIVVCAAAGNNAANNDTRPFYPASYRLPNLVAVTASNARDGRASFGNYGLESVHLAAPGMNIYSTVPLWYRTVATLTLKDQTALQATGLEFSGHTAGITAAVMDCGIGEPHQFPRRVEGKIALIERGGGLYFHEKVRNAMRAGAIAALIYNHQPGLFSGTLVGPSDWIPALAVSQADGHGLRESIQAGRTIVSLSHLPVESSAYAIWSGTSMATAFVSGALTFMSYQFPDDDPAQRIARLVDTVTQLPAFSNLVSSGGRLDLARAIDSDEDGMPDWWEIKFVGDIDTMDATTDSDGNGFLDVHEYLAGTDPTDPDDSLRLTDLTVLSDNRRLLSWLSVEQRRYAVKRAVGLPRNFTVVAPALPATPPLNTWIDPDVLPAQPVFYRIVLDED